MGTNIRAVIKVIETSIIEFCYWNEILLLKSSETLKVIILLVQELFSWVKPWAITAILTYARALSGRYFLMSRNATTWKFKLYNKMRNSVELKRCETFRGLISHETKTSEKWWRHMKTLSVKTYLEPGWSTHPCLLTIECVRLCNEGTVSKRAVAAIVIAMCLFYSL